MVSPFTEDKASGTFRKNPVEILITLTVITKISNNRFVITLFKPANSHTKFKNEYGNKVNPRIDTSYQNFMDGHSCILMQNDPPVHKIKTTRIIRNVLII